MYPLFRNGLHSPCAIVRQTSCRAVIFAPQPLHPLYCAEDNPAQPKADRYFRPGQGDNIEDALEEGNVEQHQLERNSENDGSDH